MEKLGFSMLSDRDQALYCVMEDAVIGHKNSFPLPGRYSGDDLRRVFETLMGDYPDIIHINKTVIETKASLFSNEMSFKRIASPREEREREDALKQKVSDAVFEIDSKAKNDREILQGISEYLQRTTAYDYDELKALGSARVSRRPDSHNAYGALINGLAVCEGFASAYALLAHEFGIPAMIVSGASTHFGTANIPHAWNIVAFEKNYYHVDATWDSNAYKVLENYSYSYFGLSDEDIALDHDWDFHNTPPCNKEDLSYYVFNHLVASSLDQFDAIVRRETRKRSEIIRLKLAVNVTVPGNVEEFLTNRAVSVISSTCGSCHMFETWDDTTRCFIILLK